MILTDQVQLVYLAILLCEEFERVQGDFVLDLRDVPEEWD